MSGPTIDAAAQDRASEDDRAWFRAHPGRRHRIRRPLPGETLLDPDYLTFVAVRQVQKGVRMRLSFMTNVAPPEAERTPEGEAASIFQFLVDHDDAAARTLRLMAETDHA